MRILSNFDTKLQKKLVADYRQQFGKDRVMCVRKSKFFFRWYIGFPWFLWVALCIVAVGFVLADERVPERGIWLTAGIFGMYAIGVFFKTSRKWIDYTMDFLIVTPKEVMKYNQSGVFNKEVEKLHADKIKSVTISKPGLFNSMFDIGTLTFLSEGEDEKGDIVMEYIDAIEQKERQIVHVLGNDTMGQ